MNFHPFVSALIIAAAALIFGCCPDCARDNKYVKVCRMDASKEDCLEFRDAHFSQTNTMIVIKDEDGNKYSFNKSGWSILVMDKEERKRR
jgi:hypothetical protein